MSGIISFPHEGRLSGSEIEKIAAELHRLQTDHSESLTQIAQIMMRQAQSRRWQTQPGHAAATQGHRR